MARCHRHGNPLAEKAVAELALLKHLTRFEIEASQL